MSSPAFTSKRGFPGGSDGKESDCHAGDPGSIPGSGRSPGEGHGCPLQCSCLENPVDGGAFQTSTDGTMPWEDPLEKGTAAHSSVLAWRIPWTEEPSRRALMVPCHHVSVSYCPIMLHNKLSPQIRWFITGSTYFLTHGSAGWLQHIWPRLWGQQGLAPSLGLVSGFFQVSLREPGSWRSSRAREAKLHKAGALKASASRPLTRHGLKPELVRQGVPSTHAAWVYTCASHCLRLSLLWSQPLSRAGAQSP